ncbi:MAG: hypothetical protein AMJ43_11365 [Coxiella sp. DG_40]|nr:MAG: hypothetical protein AMJ43_11365 [Coxiella sp. DG_40]
MWSGANPANNQAYKKITRGKEKSPVDNRKNPPKPPCEQTQALEAFESAYGRDEMQVSVQG